MARETTPRQNFPPLPEGGAIKLDPAWLARGTGQAALSQEVIDQERGTIGRLQPDLAMILSGALVAISAHNRDQLDPWIRGATTAHWVIRTGCPDYAPEDEHTLSAVALDALEESLWAGLRKRDATSIIEQLEVGMLPGLQAESQLASYIGGFPDQSPAFLTGAGMIAITVGHDLHAQQSAPRSAS